MSQVKVFRLGHDSVELPLTKGGGRARAVSRPGKGARERSLIYFELGQGASSVDLRHPHEAVYYVVQGEGRVVDTDNGALYPVRSGLVVYLTPNQGYRLEGPAVFAGGPCPPDPALYKSLGK